MRSVRAGLNVSSMMVGQVEIQSVPSIRNVTRQLPLIVTDQWLGSVTLESM